MSYLRRSHGQRLDMRTNPMNDIYAFTVMTRSTLSSGAKASLVLMIIVDIAHRFMAKSYSGKLVGEGRGRGEGIERLPLLLERTVRNNC